MTLSRFPFVGTVSKSNGRWHTWQLNLMGGSVIAHGQELDEEPAKAALDAAWKEKLRELWEQLKEIDHE